MIKTNGRMSLKAKLETMPNAGREHRDKIARFVIDNPGTFRQLFNLVFNDLGKLSVRAAWILEPVVFQHPELLFPYLDQFCKDVKSIRHESAIRPLAKISNLLVIKSQQLKIGEEQFLNHAHKQAFVEICFDWLIEPHKIAPQVFAMDTLYRLGNEPGFNWVHPALKDVLGADLTKRSAGYQNRALKILAKL